MFYDVLDILLNPFEFPEYANEDWGFPTDSSKHIHNKFFGRGTWRNLDLSEIYFDYCRFRNAQLVSCNFHSARIKSDFWNCKCVDTNFSLAQFQKDTSMTSVFLKCSFVGSIWEKRYSFRDCLFYECDLTDVTFDIDHDFSGTVFKRCLMPELVAERLKTLGAVVLDWREGSFQ